MRAQLKAIIVLCKNVPIVNEHMFALSTVLSYSMGNFSNSVTRKNGLGGAEISSFQIRSRLRVA